jgi:prepilin-type N-terminal cleavage/methylation domain-containing protein
MANPVPHFHSGFTLLEILLAMGVALVMVAVAVPAMDGGWNRDSRGSWGKLEALAREARERAVAERRPQVIELERGCVLRLRPGYSEEAVSDRVWKPGKGAVLEFSFPAALGSGEAPKACWTFWPDGTCEPIRVTYRDAHEAWMAVFDPLTGRREVGHD